MSWQEYYLEANLGMEEKIMYDIPDIEDYGLIERHEQISKFLIKKGIKIREHIYTELKAS